MAGKGPKPVPGFNPKKYRNSPLWDKIGPNKKPKPMDKPDDKSSVETS